MRLLGSLLALTLPLFSAPVLAVFADEAYNVDYQLALFGLPQQSTTFFHRPRQGDRASLLYTLSDVGALGAVNPSTGVLVWRHLVNMTEGSFLRAVEGENAVVSAGGDYISSWDASSGRQNWYNTFNGVVRDLEILPNLAEGKKSDVLGLYEDGDTGVLRKLDGRSGNVAWEYVDDSKDTPFQVCTNVETVFLLSLHRSMGSLHLKVTTLDLLTGKKLDEMSISTKGEVLGPQDFLFVSANAAAPIIAWADSALQSLRILTLGRKQINTVLIASGSERLEKVVLHAPHSIQSKPHFLVHKQSAIEHWADVYHLDVATGNPVHAYRLPKMAGKGAFSTSSQDANVYFSRITEEETTLVSSDSHGILGKWPIKPARGSGHPVHAVSEVVLRDSDTYAVRSAVLSSEENWNMIRGGELAWSRPEGLAGAVAAVWADITEVENLARTLQAEAHSNPLEAYFNRVKRHVSDLQHLPDYLKALPQRLLSSILPVDESTSSSDLLARDNFGLHKLVLVATERGRIYALDAGSQGRVVWSRAVFDIPHGEKWEVKGIFVDGVKGTATVKGSRGESVVLTTSDGQVIETNAFGSDDSVGSTALVDSPSGPWLLSVSKKGDVMPLPAERIPLGVVVVRGRDGHVRGLKFDAGEKETTPIVTWTFLPPSGEEIIDVTARPTNELVASIGRVLGDRSVMYKYLNPNAILLTAVSDFSSTASFYLIDSISGDVIYSTTHNAVDISQPIKTVITENWFAYSLWGEDSTDVDSHSESKGYQLVVSDLYESDLSNDRGPLGDSANYSSVQPSDDISGQTPIPHVITRAYIIPEPISHMSVTQTRQGITSRQLLCALPVSNSIVGIPRALLDPRRPVGRDPTPAEIEEGLIRYAPVIDFDPKMILTHSREVVGAKVLIASPVLLESTSLVFVAGIDVFGTIVVPSMAFDILGKGFNKLSLVLTVVALWAGVMVLAPMVRRKQINGRWQT